MVTYNLYRLDDKNRLILIDNNDSLDKLCQTYEIPDKDISFAMRICNGEFVYNNLLIKAEKEKTIDNKDEN